MKKFIKTILGILVVLLLLLIIFLGKTCEIFL